MTNTLTAALAAVLLALTVPGQAATPQDNLLAIDRIAQRQQASIERATVHAVTIQSLPAVRRAEAHQSPAGQTGGLPDTTLQMTPAEIAYEEERPWMLLSRPVTGAYRVRGGWLIHADEFKRRGHHGFYRARTAKEAAALKHNR